MNIQLKHTDIKTYEAICLSVNILIR